jgi:hypothetical protein
MLVRSLRAAGLHASDERTGRILNVLSPSRASFRLRAVVVGTVAFQTYGALLGFFTLPAQAVRTGDLDIAQDYGFRWRSTIARPLVSWTSCARPITAFTAVPKLDPSKSATYRTPDGYAVDVLTTSRHAGEEETSRLDALNTDATPYVFSTSCCGKRSRPPCCTVTVCWCACPPPRATRCTS